MVTAEGADWIHDLIHLPQRHTVHQLVQLVEILLDLVIVHQIDFVVGFVENKVENKSKPPVFVLKTGGFGTGVHNGLDLN